MLVQALQRKVMSGMSEQPGPWLIVTGMTHSSLKSPDKTDSTQRLLQLTSYQGPKLNISTWGVLSAQGLLPLVVLNSICMV
jgi:hypothetical protein